MVRRDRQQQPSPEEGYPGESGTPTTPVTPDTAVAAGAQRAHIPETVPDLPSDRIQAEYAPGTDRPERQPDMPRTAAAVAPPRDEDAPRKLTAEDKVCVRHIVLVLTTLQGTCATHQRRCLTPSQHNSPQEVLQLCAISICIDLPWHHFGTLSAPALASRQCNTLLPMTCPCLGTHRQDQKRAACCHTVLLQPPAKA